MLFKTSIIHLVHETFGTQQKGPWNLVLSKLSMSIFGSCQVILVRTKYQGSFGVDQTSYGCFEQNQMSYKGSIEILRTKFKPKKHWLHECLFCMNSFLFSRNHKTKMKLRGLCKTWTGKVCPSVRELKLSVHYRVLVTHFHDLCGVKSYLRQFLAGRGRKVTKR